MQANSYVSFEFPTKPVLTHRSYPRALLPKLPYSDDFPSIYEESVLKEIKGKCFDSVRAYWFLKEFNFKRIENT